MRIRVPFPTAPALALALALVATLAACAVRETADLSPNDEPARPTAAVAAGSIDRWLGDWGEDEGHSLRLEGGDGRYDITIQDDDGTHTFHGIAATAERVIFDRDGVVNSLVATAGRDCLAVREVDGFYCRD
jgi:hypothetical protein